MRADSHGDTGDDPKNSADQGATVILRTLLLLISTAPTWASAAALAVLLQVCASAAHAVYHSEG